MSGVVRDDYYDSDNKNIAARPEKEGFRILNFGGVLSGLGD